MNLKIMIGKKQQVITAHMFLELLQLLLLFQLLSVPQLTQPLLSVFVREARGLVIWKRGQILKIKKPCININDH